MELLITAEYHNLFPGEQDSIEELLFDIPSILVIQLVALMDATLHVHQEDLPTQGKLFNLLLNRQTVKLKADLLRRIYREDHTQTRLFTRHYNMAVIHYELTHFRELPLPEDDELSVEQEFRVFKAYFLIAEQWANPETKATIQRPEFNEDYFAKIMWPGLAAQFDLNYHIAPYHFMTRGAVLLNTLKHHTPYSAYVETYLSKHHKATSLNYVMDVCQILAVVYASSKDDNRQFPMFSLNYSPGFDTLYEQFSLDRNDYLAKFGAKPQNFAGLKSKPLLRLDEKTWIVLNWDFLANKLYEGLFYDFYQQSGIAVEPAFKQLTNFKSFVATEVTEKKLFRKLIKAAFNHKHGRLLFDEDNQPNFPDAYYRIGNKVFLIELKDAAFPAGASSSFDYEQIAGAIDQKINSKRKGTEQLLKQMELLGQKPFEKEPGYKHLRNLEIYPVIVYTDTLFNMPGVNYYVARSFQRKLTERGLALPFRTVKPLTLINLNYLIGIFYLLREKETSLDKVIEFYHHQIANREKKHEREPKMENHITLYDVFEYVVAPLFDGKTSDKIVRELFDALDLAEGLPPRLEHLI